MFVREVFPAQTAVRRIAKVFQSLSMAATQLQAPYDTQCDTHGASTRCDESKPVCKMQIKRKARTSTSTRCVHVHACTLTHQRGTHLIPGPCLSPSKIEGAALPTLVAIQSDLSIATRIPRAELSMRASQRLPLRMASGVQSQLAITEHSL